MNREFLDAIEANPIIAAVKDEQGLSNCLSREELTVIFILYGDIRSIGEIVERIQTRTRQFAKRQLTWFRSLPGCHWCPADPDVIMSAWAAPRK